MFQFTHPRGVRRIAEDTSTSGLSAFQFTHPRGVRRFLFTFSFYVLEFQFTHPRGVRRRSGRNRQNNGDSFNSQLRDVAPLAGA